jgi:hypothetical protein
MSFGFRFFGFCAVCIHVLFDCIAVPECKCKQCGFVHWKGTKPLQQECTKPKSVSPGLLKFESLREVLNFECLVVRYTYELQSTFNVDCESKSLPHSGTVDLRLSPEMIL